jgi:hypothetical protein
MILSFRDTGDGSAGFSYVGSSSISNSVLSRGSTLSTRPSVEGRFSTAVAVSQSCGATRVLDRPVARRRDSRTHGEDVLVLASERRERRERRKCWTGTRGYARMSWRRTEERWARERRRRPDGTRRAESRLWMSHKRFGGEGSGLRAKGCLKRVAAAADWRDSCQARVLAAGPNLQSLVGHAVGR